MSQNIKDFFVPSDDLTELPETPPELREILLNLSSSDIPSSPDISSSPDIPSRRSPRNHNNNKKNYVLPK